jgi:ABC-type glycerol-3-phosphate transport system substrate-binding protein
MRFHRTTAMAVAGAMSFGLLAACSDGSTPEPGPGADDEGTGQEQVTITVAGLLPGAEQEAIDSLNARVEQFQDAYPDIVVEPQEYQWLATTFSAQLAGGTLPTVFEIPVTDGRTLIENGQLADIDAQVRELDYADEFNEEIMAIATDDAGTIFAVPAKSFYSVALHYNRNLFEQAGLDPDDPPSTWDEIREAAKVITEKTGVPGYGMMALDNAGGWQLAAAAYSRGGRIQVSDGDSYTATLDDPAVAEHLEWLKDLRWEDGSVYPDVSLGWGEINQAFAAGQLAMYTSGSDIYSALVENQGVTADWGYGLTALPLEGDDAGVLGGGTLAAVSATATEAEKEAAVKWIDFWYLRNLRDKDAAVENAQVRFDAGQAVGTPVLPIFSQEQYEESLTWVEKFINVPLDHMTGYTDVMFDQPLVGEASAATQDTYALLFPIVQAVLTDPNADIEALLATANVQAQALIDQG